MKKRLVFLIIVAILLITVPVSASGHEVIGERLNISPVTNPPGESQTFPENTPFHVEQGWHTVVNGEGEPGVLAKASFALELDEVYLEEDFIYRYWDQDLGLIKHIVYNFPEGMTGTHTFTGHWYIQCKYWQEVCDDPNEILEAAINQVVVYFVH